MVSFLDRETEIETSYGGNFVDSINGVESVVEDGRSLDWYYYVNGIWSPVGAGEATVHAGDRIWWDYRDWTGAYRVPAVVGSFPQPFLSGLDGERYPTELVCLDSAEQTGACETAETALTDAGAEPARTALEDSDPKSSLRVIVGTWDEVRRDPTARTMETGPGRSGVYAAPAGAAAPGSGASTSTTPRRSRSQAPPTHRGSQRFRRETRSRPGSSPRASPTGWATRP